MTTPKPMTMTNDHFVFYRKIVQRKTGGTTNKFVITVRTFHPSGEVEREEMLRILKTFGGEDFGPRSRIFDKRADAEKAWVYINLRWA